MSDVRCMLKQGALWQLLKCFFRVWGLGVGFEGSDSRRVCLGRFWTKVGEEAGVQGVVSCSRGSRVQNRKVTRSRQPVHL